MGNLTLADTWVRVSASSVEQKKNFLSLKRIIGPPLSRDSRTIPFNWLIVSHVWVLGARFRNVLSGD